MATTNLNAYSIAYPTISNRIRVDISAQSDPGTIIQTETEVAPHDARIWSFPGLPRTNYIYEMSEIDDDGNKLRQLAYFDVVPSLIPDSVVRPDEQIQVGVTPGLVAGTNSFVFDGTDGKPDYIGWEVSFEEYSGVGTMIKGVDYSWDSEIGAFALLQEGAVLADQQYYTARFEPKTIEAGGSVSTISDYSTRIVNNDYDIQSDDFGNEILCEPSFSLITLTLPDIASTPAGRPLRLKTGTPDSGEFCVQVVQSGTDVIKFLRGNIYMQSEEEIEIVKLVRAADDFEWRVRIVDGNFKTVGKLVSFDSIADDTFGALLLDGSSVSSEAYARLYNEFVLNLPAGQVTTYLGHLTFPAKFSLKDSGTGEFYLPDRRNLFERGTTISVVAGTYQVDTVGPHKHTGVPLVKIDVDRGTGGSLFSIDEQGSTANSGENIGSETRPKNYSTNKYILI